MHRRLLAMALASALGLTGLGCTLTDSFVDTTAPRPAKTDHLGMAPAGLSEKRNPRPETCYQAGVMFEEAATIAKDRHDQALKIATNENETAAARLIIGKDVEPNLYKARLAYQQTIDLNPRHKPAYVGLARIAKKKTNTSKWFVISRPPCNSTPSMLGRRTRRFGIMPPFGTNWV